MGQAKRRKELGDYPQQTPKPRTKARMKLDNDHLLPYVMALLAAQSYPKLPGRRGKE